MVGVAFKLSIISLRSLFFSLQRDAQGRLDLLTVMLAGAACVSLDARPLLLSLDSSGIEALDEPALKAKRVLTAFEAPSDRYCPQEAVRGAVQEVQPSLRCRLCGRFKPPQTSFICSRTEFLASQQRDLLKCERIK